MIQIKGRKDPKLGRIVALSFFLHALIVAVIFRLSLFYAGETAIHSVYQVDILDLPASSPEQAVAPSDTDSSGEIKSEPADKTGSASTSSLHSKSGSTPAKGGLKPAGKGSDAAESAEEVSRKIEQLREQSDARHAAEAIAKIRGSKGSASTGIISGTGSEKGVDYTAYIHQSLAAAFKETITYQSRNPETAVKIVIDPKGRLIGTKVDKRSGDKLFDDAVLRAIGKAARNFKAPPDKRVYEHGFVFKPEGVGK